MHLRGWKYMHEKYPFPMDYFFPFRVIVQSNPLLKYFSFIVDDVMVKEWQCDWQAKCVDRDQWKSALFGENNLSELFFLSRRKESFCLAFSPLAYPCRWEVLWACFHIRRSLLLLKHAGIKTSSLLRLSRNGLLPHNFSPLRLNQKFAKFE